MPQKLIATEAPISHSATSPILRSPRDPDGDERQREHHEVVAESVSELDPALAEVHEVDDRDRGDREGGPGHELERAKPRSAGIARR